jgi:DNA-binding protein HU-beta
VAPERREPFSWNGASQKSSGIPGWIGDQRASGCSGEVKDAASPNPALLKQHNGNSMARPAKIKTKFPSVFETAKRLGVSKHDAAVLSEMAERSLKSGEFAIPGVGRLVRVERKASARRNPKTGESIKMPAKKVVTFRVAKATKNAITRTKRK